MTACATESHTSEERSRHCLASVFRSMTYFPLAVCRHVTDASSSASIWEVLTSWAFTRKGGVPRRWCSRGGEVRTRPSHDPHNTECELLDRRVFLTQVEARMEVFRYIEGWYNPRRRHSALGYLSPVHFEAEPWARLRSVLAPPAHSSHPSDVGGPELCSAAESPDFPGRRGAGYRCSAVLTCPLKWGNS